jgi:hypothetical protein
MSPLEVPLSRTDPPAAGKFGRPPGKPPAARHPLRAPGRRRRLGSAGRRRVAGAGLLHASRRYGAMRRCICYERANWLGSRRGTFLPTIVSLLRCSDWWHPLRAAPAAPAARHQPSVLSVPCARACGLPATAQGCANHWHAGVAGDSLPGAGRPRCSRVGRSPGGQHAAGGQRRAWAPREGDKGSTESHAGGAKVV